MTFEQLTEALDKANIPFSIEGMNHDEIYIDDVLILYGGDVYAEPDQDKTYFNTSFTSSKPLASVKLEDLQPVIRHYRKVHPASLLGATRICPPESRRGKSKKSS